MFSKMRDDQAFIDRDERMYADEQADIQRARFHEVTDDELVAYAEARKSITTGG